MRRYAVPLFATAALALSLLLLPTIHAKLAGKGEPSALIPNANITSTSGAQNAIPRPANMMIQSSSGLTMSVSQAADFGVTPAMRDLPPEEEFKLEDVAAEEVKIRPPRVFRDEAGDTGPVQADSVAQTSMPSPSLPSPNGTFDGGSSDDNAVLFGSRVLPPDTVGDVGPNHYVQMTNLTWRIYDKSGTPLTPTRKLSSIWNSLGAGNPCSTRDDGDPIVRYDRLADRWLLTQFCTAATPFTHQLMAVSRTGDPTGAYYVYDFLMPNNKFNDYPKFGVWPDAYYMTDNQFTSVFVGAGVFAFDRAKMLVGDPTASYVYFDLATSPSTSSAGGLLPADMDGLNPPPPGTPNTFAYFTAGEFADPQGDALRLFDFHVDFANPASSTFTERPESPVAVAAFDPRSPSGRDDIEQPPPAVNASEALDSISDRLMHRLQYRNFGSHETLVVNHTVNVGTGTTLAAHQAGVRYYELRRTGAGGFGVHEQATFAPDTDNRWMGSAAEDHQGNLAVGYSVSSTTTFPSIRYAGRLATDPSGGLFQGENTLHAGTFVQRSTSSRWGDYSSLNVDPVDDCTFWFTTEYYGNDDPTNTAEWRTRIGSFKFAQCTPPPQGTLQGVVTNCETGLPVPGALVQISNGFSQVSDAGGNYARNVAPGTYTVSTSIPGFQPGTGTATVTDGNTTVVNLCVTPQPIITTGGSALTAESCSPFTGGIDPGETVTVDLSLKNVGTADTTNLVATLLPSGGVTSPSAPQSYGVTTVGGPAVTRSFTFTADTAQACGSVITTTLQLQDGTNNLGTVSYTFTVGALSAPIVNTYTSGNISTPIPDVSSVDIPINITDTGAVSDVNVRVRLNHTFDGDVRLSLVHPDGTIINLSNNRGGSGDNFGTGSNNCSGTPTVFDDQAATAIASGVAPFAGTFRPEQPLSGLNGKSITGTWKLRVADTASLDVGTVGCVQLVISQQQYLCCPFADGTPNPVAAPPAVVTAESCAPPNGAPDPDETVTVDFPIKNVGTGITNNLVATLLPTGGVLAPSGPQSYGAIPPIGPGVSRPFTFTAAGSCGSTITATLHLTDGATDYGNVTYTLVLGGTQTTVHGPFSNTASISIPSSGAATPFPSTINVSGITGSVSKVTVKLNSFNHTFPDDVDVLLVGPAGQKLLLLSDAGGSTDAVNATLTFDDAASAVVPDGGPTVSGTFRPTNFGTGDTFPAPAPVGPHPDPQLLSVFNGTNPNGAWRLFVVDDVSSDTGSFAGGWSLTITTSDPVCCFGECALDVPSNIVVNNDPGQCGAVVNFPTTFSGSCGVVTANPPSGSFFPTGTTAVTITGTRQDGSTTTGTFNVTVLDAEAPTISCPADITVSNDADACAANVSPGTATATDNCSVASVVGVRSDGQVLNAPYPVGTTTITWTATDASGNTASCTQAIKVNDTQAPGVSPFTVALSSLPRAGHDLHNVGLSGSFSDNCPGSTRQILVYGDEDDDEPTGDGNHSSDAMNIGVGTLRLRGERKGDGDGRVYLIVEKVTDAYGNVTYAVATVVVAKSGSAADAASVNAQATAAKSHFMTNNAPPPGFFVIGDGPVIGPKQ